jgi:hypothetical protein
MPREIKLNGGEISMLKTLGLSGTAMNGKQLLDRVEDMAEAEFIDTLDGLISLGYVLSSRVNLRKTEDVERASLRVNQAYARDLKEAINPSRGRERVRRERRG